MTRLPALAILALAALAPPLQAQDCSRTTEYEGSPAMESAVHSVPESRFAPGARLDAAVSDKLADAVRQARSATGAPALGAAVLTPSGEWISDGSERPFYWASTGKLLTAVIVLQLIEEGRLSLDTPLGNFVNGVPEGDRITIAQLLSHTSGLRSANEIVREEKLPSPASLGEEIEMVASRGLLFCPGSNWRYSNTGYALLGEVIERIEGAPYAEAVQNRIAQPLGLGTLRIVTEPGDDGYVPLAPSGEARPFHPSRAGSAGALVASPSDMVRFMAGLLEGQLVTPETLRMMGKTAYPMFDAGTFYGLGLMVYRFPGPDGNQQQWIGHSGGVPGAKAVLAYDESAEAIVAVALTGDGSPEASANLIMRTLTSG